MGEFGFEDPEIIGRHEENEVQLHEKYQLVIDCDSEADMQEKYNILKRAGIECRTSTL